MPKRNGPVHVATTKRTYNGKVYVSHLLRRSYRDGAKVKHETLGNLSHLPPDLIEVIRCRLRGGVLESAGHCEIVRSLPHGHVAAVIGMLRKLGLESLLASRRCRQRDVVTAMVVARILAPSSKLATARTLREETATSSLGLELGLTDIDNKELYKAMDWLLARQTGIETKLAKQHLKDGTLVLYDVSSSYYTGECSGLVNFGLNRDGDNGYPQIVYGLLCNADGCPVAIEVFEGNTVDAKTFPAQVRKVRERFGIQRVVFVGDRGMLTSRRIDEDLRGIEGLDWITALRADHIRRLTSEGLIQPSLFDERDLAEISSPDYPGERLVVCRNPLLADQRTRKREELLQATEKKLNEIVAATTRSCRALRGKDRIGLRVGKVLNQYKVGKHFILEIEDNRFSYRRDQARIAQEQALDGIYVVRTSVPRDVLASEDTVRAYKNLSYVEQAFRCVKSVDLKVRPIFHWLDDRIRAHVFLCMLAYYVEWHLRRTLAPILFEDDDREAAEATRKSIVAPAPRSQTAKDKDLTKRTADDYPVHSFHTLLADLGTLTKNRIRIAGNQNVEYTILTQPTRLQQRVFELLDVKPTL